MTKLLKGGFVIDPQNKIENNCDLLIEDGLIKDVQAPGNIKQEVAKEVIDVSGKWVLPGLVDIHVHFREPGHEWKEDIFTGSKAAIKGGYTCVCPMPNTSPVNDSEEITRYMYDKAASANLCRVLPIGAVTKGSLGKELAPLSELKKAGCVAFSDDGEPIYDSGIMRRALEWCLMLDATISCHEEDKCLSCSGSMNESALSARLGLTGMPTVAEDVMVARDIELARHTGAKVHLCHLSSARSVELVRRAKNDGLPVTAEVTPHHLVFDESHVETYDTKFKMSPPLRDWENIEALIEGLKDGTIDAVASDHAPHDFDTKEVEFAEAAMGVLGLQTSLPVMLKLVTDGRVSKSRAVELLASGPAKCFGLEYGSLSIGAKADIAVINPDMSWQFSAAVNESKSLNSPFLGMDLKGQAEMVFVDGACRLKDGKICLE